MQSCKIRGLATYHKCIKDLQRLGYVNYSPSYHPARGSQVTLNAMNSMQSDQDPNSK